MKRGIEKIKHCASRKGARPEPTAVQSDPDRGGRSVIACRQTRVSNLSGYCAATTFAQRIDST